MVRATNKTKKKTNANETDKTDSGVLSAIKAFSAIDFKLKPTFKKKAKSSNKHQKAPSSFVKNGLKTINNLLKSKAIKAQKPAIKTASVAFTKVYRNKPKKNYTNKSSHLSNITTFRSKLIRFDDAQNSDRKNTSNKKNKKLKRSLRRKHLKKRIEIGNKWMMNRSMNGSIHGSIHDANITNDDETDEKSLMSIDALKDSLKDAEKEIVLERKHKSKRNKKREIENDKNNLSALFQSELFDSNPIKYTTNILKQEQEALNMKSELELKEQQLLYSLDHKKHRKNGFGDKYRNALKKGTKRNNGSSLSDVELKKQITKQMTLMKEKSANKKKLKLVSNGKFKRKLKLKKSKNGKYIQRKIRKKMNNVAKDNQKKRRWRI